MCCWFTFTEGLDEREQVGGLARVQDLAQGPDVVLGQAQGLDLGQLLCLGVARHHAPQPLQSIVQPVHPVSLPRIGLHPAHLEPLNGNHLSVKPALTLNMLLLTTSVLNKSLL